MLSGARLASQRLAPRASRPFMMGQLMTRAAHGKDKACAHAGGFHDLASKDIAGTAFSFGDYRDKVVVVTNVASK